MPPLAAAAALPIMGTTLGTVLSVASTGMSVLSAIQGRNAAKAQATAQQTAGAYQAKSARANAVQEEAIGQKRAEEVGRQGQLAQSKALALAAAGGDASDVSTVNAIGDLGGQTEYNKLMELYQGKERANSLRQGADLSMYEGNAAARSTRAKGQSDFIAGMGTALSNGSSLWDKYAPTGFGGRSTYSSNLGRIEWNA